MVAIHIAKAEDAVVLRVDGELDGSGAWRVVRLALRLARGHLLYLDLSSVTRMLGFGAAVLARGLARAATRIIAVRPEHRRLLAAEGLLTDDVSLHVEPAA